MLVFLLFCDLVLEDGHVAIFWLYPDMRDVIVANVSLELL